MVIVAATKPVSGRMDRICLKCNDNYFGWNMYVCHSCESEGNYVIAEVWAK